MLEKIRIKYIDGYNNMYAITDHGEVVSFHKKSQNKEYMTKSLAGNTNMKDNMYYTVGLWDGKKIKRVRLHRLVCEAFNENPDNLSVVMHLDNNKLNCHYTNLKWGTSKENVQHAYDTGRIRVKHKNGDIWIDERTGTWYEKTNGRSHKMTRGRCVERGIDFISEKNKNPKYPEGKVFQRGHSGSRWWIKEGGKIRCLHINEYEKHGIKKEIKNIGRIVYRKIRGYEYPFQKQEDGSWLKLETEKIYRKHPIGEPYFKEGYKGKKLWWIRNDDGKLVKYKGVLNVE